MSARVARRLRYRGSTQAGEKVLSGAKSQPKRAASHDKPARTDPDGERCATAGANAPSAATSALQKQAASGRARRQEAGNAEPTRYQRASHSRLTILGDLPALTGLLQAVA